MCQCREELPFGISLKRWAVVDDRIVSLLDGSFVDSDLIAQLLKGIICMSVAIVGVVYYIVGEFNKKNKAQGEKESFGKTFGTFLKNSVDYETIVFLVSLFIIIFAVETVGIINDISQLFVKIGKGGNIFLLYTLIVFGSVLISAFIDNIPYVATMLPVIKGVVLGLGASYNVEILLYFGLLCGATLGLLKLK